MQCGEKIDILMFIKLIGKKSRGIEPTHADGCAINLIHFLIKLRIYPFVYLYIYHFFGGIKNYIFARQIYWQPSALCVGKVRKIKNKKLCDNFFFVPFAKRKWIEREGKITLVENAMLQLS